MSAEFKIEIMKGVVVNVLITPRLFIYKGREGVTLEADGESMPAVMALYADVLYCAALNWWELSGKDADEIKFKRMDFHVWAAEHQEEFGRLVVKMVRLLSGKSLAELAKEEKEKEEKEKEKEESKKKFRFGSITTAWKRFWSGIAARLRKKQAGQR